MATLAQYVRTSERACHDGKSTLSLKLAQDLGFICLLEDGRAVRWEVESGSNPAWPGVRRAFRFWVIESSMAPRDIRRKSRHC